MMLLACLVWCGVVWCGVVWCVSILSLSTAYVVLLCVAAVQS